MCLYRYKLVSIMVMRVVCDLEWKFCMIRTVLDQAVDLTPAIVIFQARNIFVRYGGRSSLQVAQGMAGLEGADPPIVHRDLKPSNVLLDGEGHAQIADMNLSLRLSEDSLAMLTGETGTYLYMSPEMMRHEVQCTT